MPNLRLLLLNIVISGITSGIVAWSLLERHPTSGGTRQPSIHQIVETASPTPPSDQELVEDLEAFAAVPDADAEGQSSDALSDDAITGMDHRATLDFVKQADAMLSREPDPSPSLCFSLGRVALLQGEIRIARRYLSKAAKKTYGAAYGYLGDPQLSGTPLEQWTNYSTAERYGFRPARAWKKNLEAKATAAIERLTGDPQDPDLPQGVYGISNARIMALDTAAIDTLIQDYGFYAKIRTAPAYLAYGIGRAAFLHQMFDDAKEYLNLAAQKGSAAAYSYLAYPELTSDLDQRIAFLQKAAAGNYKPGIRMLKDAIELRRQIPAAR